MHDEYNMPDGYPEFFSDTPLRRPRFRLRYSLKTLMLFVAFVGMGVGLFIRSERHREAASEALAAVGYRAHGNRKDGLKRIKAILQRMPNVANARYYAIYESDEDAGPTFQGWRPYFLIAEHRWTTTILKSAVERHDPEVVRILLSHGADQYWWGSALLPQFLMTILLAVGFLWSLWRDYIKLMWVQPN